MGPLGFEIEATRGVVRAGRVVTPHGSFVTPAFTVVGTKGTVKGIHPGAVKALGVEVVLSNTYHLFLQPGEVVVAEAGGLNTFMGWDGPTITDSGGFQVFSLGAGFGKKVSKFNAAVIPESDVLPTVYDAELATQHGKLAQVDDEGVTFTSHLDGSLHRFTPERSVEIQHKLGADIFFAFDECTSPEADKGYQKEAMDRTHAWARRSLAAHRQNVDANRRQAIFGVVQGGRYPDLREESGRAIGGMGFDGFGIGGSFSKADLGEALAAAIRPLPGGVPRHLLGIGEPEDIFEGVAHGIDMFDCVLPTRLGRTGTIFTARGKVDLNRERHIRDFTPLDPETPCPATDGMTRAYLSHLFRAGEILGGVLASMQNIYFIQKLMRDIRQSILDNRFDAFRTDFLLRYTAGS